MHISQRIIGASAPVAPVTPVPCVVTQAAQQSSSTSVWELHKRTVQILEVKQQIETTNTNDKYRIKSLKRKLKQLESQQALNNPRSTLDPETSAWSPPSTASQVLAPGNALNPTAPEWSPPILPMAKLRAIRFEDPIPADHVGGCGSRWGPGGLNPYTYKLLGGELLAAISDLTDSIPAVNEIIPTDESFPAVKQTIVINYDDDDDDDGDSTFFYVTHSPALSFVDSGYWSSG